MCGTDREIDAGEFGTPPPGETDLVLGHELLGEVSEDGGGFTEGDLVTATVRRSCGHCGACAEGLTGRLRHRRLHGARHHRPGRLRRRARGGGRRARRGRAAGARPPRGAGRAGLDLPAGSATQWRSAAASPGGRRALVLGAGAIGMLATYMLRLAGHEVWTVARSEPSSERAGS